MPYVEKYLKTRVNFDVNTLRKRRSQEGFLKTASLLIKADRHYLGGWLQVSVGEVLETPLVADGRISSSGLVVERWALTGAIHKPNNLALKWGSAQGEGKHSPPPQPPLLQPSAQG